jgi:SAM-dependent methyltransferase
MPTMSVEAQQLHDPDAATRFYDARFRRGYMDDWPDAKCDRVAAFIRELPLPISGRALDFGCGAGVFARVLRRALPQWDVHGTDLSSAAVQIAAQRNPDCRFYTLSECSARAGDFDLVFTHHVLEHVSSLVDVAEMLANLTKVGGSMIHILPCGDQGSLERAICGLRADGIDARAEGRFFYEEEGHLRRLTTDRLVRLWAGAGFQLERAYYANQRIGGLRFLTQGDSAFILSVTDTTHAIDSRARFRLHLLRAALLGLWFARKPVSVVHNKLRGGCKNVRDVATLAAGVVCFPVSWFIESGLNRLVDFEWRKRRHLPGSEMYVHLLRTAVRG